MAGDRLHQVPATALLVHVREHIALFVVCDGFFKTESTFRLHVDPFRCWQVEGMLSYLPGSVVRLRESGGLFSANRLFSWRSAMDLPSFSAFSHASARLDPPRPRHLARRLPPLEGWTPCSWPWTHLPLSPRLQQLHPLPLPASNCRPRHRTCRAQTPLLRHPQCFVRSTVARLLDYRNVILIDIVVIVHDAGWLSAFLRAQTLLYIVNCQFGASHGVPPRTVDRGLERYTA